MILFLVVLLAFSWHGQAQLFISENFDSGIPDTWGGNFLSSTVNSCEVESAKRNIYSYISEADLITPNYEQVSNGTDLTVSFDYKIIDLAGSNDATQAGWGNAQIQYSTDDGTTWVTASTIDDSNHTESTECTTHTTTVDATNLPLDSDIKLRLLVTWADGDYYFIVDNFETSQVINCTFPEVTTSIVEDCANSNYTIEIDVTDLGDASGLTISNDISFPDVPVTSTGVISYGPIPAGTEINLLLEHNDDSDCNLDLGTFQDLCPAQNDNIAGATPLTPSAPGTGCDAYTFDYDFSDGTVTDSGLDGSCQGSLTGLDLFFTWTATSAALVWNDGLGGPGIVIRQPDGTEITCASSFAPEDTVLSGWSIGDDLIIQVYDFSTAQDPISFCLEELTCPQPTNLEAENLTFTSADLSWEANGSESEWTVMYGLKGFDPLTEGTEVSDNDGTLGVELSGLSASTLYDFYVKANCSATNESYLSETHTFATDCEVITSYPLTENFDETWYGDPEAPLCWTVINNDEDMNTWNQSSQYITPRSGSYFAQGTGNNDDYLISPALDFSATGDIQMLWFDAVEGASNNNTYDVLVSITDKQISSFTDNLGTYDVTNTSWEEHDLDLSAYSGQTIYIAFHQTYSASTFWGFAIDDVTFKEQPACIKPSGVVASNITGSSLDLTWNAEASEVSGYEWFVMAENEDPETDTPIQTGTTATGGTSVVISGLSETTTYDVYVRTNCDTEGMSDYSNKLTIQTTETCAAPTDVTHNEITSTSTTAVFNWTASNSEELGYNWILMNEGDDPTVDTPVDSGTTSQGETVLVISGLTENTAYDFYILSNCDTNGLSDQVGPVNFETACEVFTPDYVEEFSIFTPACWIEAVGGDEVSGPESFGSSGWLEDGFVNEGTTGSARINLYTNSRKEWLISPSFDLSVDGYELVFDVAITDYYGQDLSAMGSDDKLYVLYTTDGTTWTELESWEAGNEPSNTEETVVLDLTGITGSSVNFAFFATDGSIDDAEDYSLYVDNFKVRTPLACPEVLDLTVDNITQTGADLMWTDDVAAVNGYVWSVFEEGSDPSADTPVETGTTVAGETTVTVTGLLANSSYNAYVKGDCDADGFGPLSVATNFETAFGAIIVTPGTTETETHCYDSNETTEWLYESSDGSALKIEFIQGTLETDNSGGTYDDLMIYDGIDDTGAVLYDSDNPPSNAGELAGLMLTANSGSMYISLISDLTTSCATGSQTEIIFNVDAGVTTGNQDFFSEANFSYYPNPVESRFEINSTYELEKVVIFNMLGQEVRNISPKSTDVSFNLSDVQAGVFLIKTTVKGQTQTFRLIKE